MVQAWIDEFQHVDLDYIAGDSPDIGRPYDEMSHPKICLHTTEGDSIEGAQVAFRKYPPHIACEYEGQKIHQYLPLTHCSFSLAGSESDDEFVIQIEIVGRAANAPNFWLEELDWIGAKVLAPIWRAGVNFALVGAPQGFHGGDEGIRPYISTSTSPIRFPSYTALREFSGVMGHQHAPAPDTHWDPGRMDVARILASTAAALNVGPVPAPVPTPPPVPAPVPSTWPTGGKLLWPVLSTSVRSQYPVHTSIVQQVTGATRDGDYYLGTKSAVAGYQRSYGLYADGVCGAKTATLILQNILRDWGIYGGALDGIYGPGTSVAVAKLQQFAGLRADGYCGVDTTNAIWFFIVSG